MFFCFFASNELRDGRWGGEEGKDKKEKKIIS